MNQERDEIAKALDNILAHKTFASSRKARRFLSYVMTEYLEGRVSKLSETTIAQDVFDLGPDFDPAQNAIVRVTAGRVRQMLNRYNAQDIDGASVRLSIPKGGYQPHFETLITPSALLVGPASADSPNLKGSIQAILTRKRRPPFAVLAAGMTLLTAALSFTYLSSLGASAVSTTAPLGAHKSAMVQSLADYPLIAVTQFENQTGNTRYNFMEIALQKRLIDDLARFQIVRSVPHKGTEAGCYADPKCPYDYIIAAHVLSVEPEFKLDVKLIEKESRDVLYEKRIIRSTETTDYFDSLSGIVSQISGDFAGHDGAIVRQKLGFIEDQIENGVRDLTQVQSLECVEFSRKAFYRRGPEPYRKAYSCLDNLLKNDPDNPTLLSVFGNLIYLGARSPHESIFEARSIDPDISIEKGVAMMRRAVALDPNNGISQHRLAAYFNQIGDRPNALKHAELAHLANPSDLDITFFLALRLAGNGQWDRAFALNNAAKPRFMSPHPNEPRVDFLYALDTGDALGLKRAADEMARRNHFHKDLFLFVSAVANEDKKTVSALRPAIRLLASRAKKPEQFYRIPAAVGNEQLISKSRDLLIKGGIYNESDELLTEDP